MLNFSLVNGQVDTLAIPAFDTTITSAQTSYNLGLVNSNTAILPSATPTINVYPNSNFTYKRRAALDYNVDDFPLRAAVKIFTVNEDSLGHLCSGIMISSKHVLTAAHCVCLFNTDSLFVDSLLVSPGYDQGSENPSFGMTEVSNVYFFEGWNIGSEDIAILELDTNLGTYSGWIAVGFEEDNSILGNGNFFKFTYPALTNFNIDPKEYNGDTLFYNYGVVDILSANHLAINGTSGIGGESGSSLVKIENGQQYTSYGTLSFSNNLGHSRITDWKFYSIKEVIEDALSISEEQVAENQALRVYPNPSNGEVYLSLESHFSEGTAVISDMLGRTLSIQELKTLGTAIQLPEPNGVYVISVMKDGELLGRTRVVKQ